MDGGHGEVGDGRRAAGKTYHEGINNQGVQFANCEIYLEKIAKNMNDISVNGKPAPFIFRNSIVHYHGGDLPANSLIFYNCVFRFDVLTVPIPKGAQAMRLLAASDSENKVEIPG